MPHLDRISLRRTAGRSTVAAFGLPIFIVATLLLTIASSSLDAQTVIGGEFTYTVQKGDTLPLVGAKNGVFWRNIITANNLDDQVPLVAGTTLRINTRRIVPRIVESGILINIADRTLYFFKDGQLRFYPVGVGTRPLTGESDWRTPTGKFYVRGKRRNPTWHVPQSILLESRLKGKELEDRVGPGPDNPLGEYAIETSLPNVLIHSTTSPRSVYRYSSHGCLRMLPDHMKQFFSLVQAGTEGEIIYEPVKIAVTENGKVYLEARTDVYKRSRPLREEAARLIASRGLDGRVDWSKVERIVRDQTGIAEDITLRPPEPPTPRSSTRDGFAFRKLLYLIKF